MDYKKFGIQVEAIIEMYQGGCFNDESNIEKAVIERIEVYLKRNRYESIKKKERDITKE